MEPRKITRRESEVFYLMYFGILSRYDVPMPKLYLLLFLLCYVLNLVSRQRLLQMYVFCVKMKLLVIFCICVREFGSITTAKVFTEEISLFVSIRWPSSRTCIPYFGKRSVT